MRRSSACDGQRLSTLLSCIRDPLGRANTSRVSVGGVSAELQALTGVADAAVLPAFALCFALCACFLCRTCARMQRRADERLLESQWKSSARAARACEPSVMRRAADGVG